MIATGVVKVDANRKTVQHLEGGIVSEILVKDGDRVNAGQTLIVLTDERVSATIEVLSGQLDAEQAKAARLQAERDGLATIEFPSSLEARRGNPQIADLLDDEQAFFDAKRQRLDNQIALLGEQSARIQEEIAGLSQQVAAEEEAARLLGREIEKNVALERKHYVQETQILTLNRTLQEYLARRGEHLADIARARQKMTDMEMRRTTLAAEHVQAAADELTAVKARVFDLEERVRPSIDAQTRQRIVAPLAGTVVDLKVHTIGGVVGPREPVLDIVPDENPLIIEARVDVTGIDDVRLGNVCDVRLSAFKARSTPLVSGTVTYISADRFEDPATRVPYYTMHVELDPQSLHQADVTLTPGMPAEVYVRTRTRSALEYLLEPVTVFLGRSLRES